MAGGVQLVPLARTHAAAMLSWVRDPEVAEAIGLSREPSLAATESFIARSQAGEDLSGFAILREGRHIGNVVLDEIDRDAGSARLSIYIGAHSERGRGTGTEATRAALDHAFGSLGLRRVWLHVHEHNVAAIRAYERAGFVHESRDSRSFALAGARVDSVRMAIEAEEDPQR